MRNHTNRTQRWMGRGPALLLVITVSIAAMLFAAPGAEAKKKTEPAQGMDTAAHHMNQGYQLLEQRRTGDAVQEFKKALELDKKNAQAMVGLALGRAWQRDYPAARKQLRKARRRMESKEDKLIYHTGWIQFVMIAKEAGDVDEKGVPGERWIDSAEWHYWKAKRIDKSYMPAHYHVGRAYLRAGDYEKAQKVLKIVVDNNGALAPEADDLLARALLIERAQPSTDTGWDVALVDRITRAEMAALLVEEFQLPELYAKARGKDFDTQFSPDGEDAGTGGRTWPEDIAGHPLHYDLKQLLRIGVLGLEPFADGSFKPDQPVTRAEFALMLQDIYVTITGRKALRTKYLDEKSHFPDVPEDHFAFNAAHVAVDLGLLEVRDKRTMEFGLKRPVSGADALMTLRELNKLL